MSQVQHRVVEANGIHLRIAEQGSGPLVILCHGFPDKRALALHEALLPIWNAMNGDNLPASVRNCQELHGRKAGVPRASMPPTSPRQQGPIRRALEAAELL